MPGSRASISSSLPVAYIVGVLSANSCPLVVRPPVSSLGTLSEHAPSSLRANTIGALVTDSAVSAMQIRCSVSMSRNRLSEEEVYQTFFQLFFPLEHESTCSCLGYFFIPQPTPLSVILNVVIVLRSYFQVGFSLR